MTDSTKLEHQLYQQLLAIYSQAQARQIMTALDERLAPTEGRRRHFSEHDVILTAYPDHLQRSGMSPLQALHAFCRQHLNDGINGLHLLPFYPSSSDDGYAVTDFTQVNQEFGGWEHIRELATDFDLMFDLPLNHVSAWHPWFRAFLDNDPHYREYFIALPPDTDTSEVVRPRTHPLLSRFTSTDGRPVYVWTTFSQDQVDLNYANPDVLLEIIDIMLGYVARGTRRIRLDAVGFLWKRADSSSLHMPRTHQIVRVLRTVLDITAPSLQLVTETNVPHEENLTYFGNGGDEAQLVYNFPLPPLLLHTLYNGDTRVLQEWARHLKTPSEDTALLNFTASHDGIGLRPVDGILDAREVSALTNGVQRRGGCISYRELNDGSLAPYELNISYFDATSQRMDDTSQQLSIARYMLTQSVMLALAGVPVVYFSSLFGVASWLEGVEQRGLKRAINREKFEINPYTGLPQLPASRVDGARSREVFRQYQRLLEVRSREPAFHPQAPQRIIQSPPALFVLERTSPQRDARILALHNFSSGRHVLSLPPGQWHDLISDGRFSGSVTLHQYQFRWLKQEV